MSGKRKKQDWKEQAGTQQKQGECPSYALPLGIEEGDVRSAIHTLIEHDESMMQKIMDTVTQVIVAKLMDNQHFKDTLVKHAMQAGVLDRTKQELRESRDIEHEQAVNKMDAIQKQVSELENNDHSLRYAIDTQEQYSST